MRVVKAAAVQLRPVLYSREGTVEKVVRHIHELSIGVNERDDETLFNTQLLFVADRGERGLCTSRPPTLRALGSSTARPGTPRS
jgi:hypothetical protein